MFVSVSKALQRSALAVALLTGGAMVVTLATPTAAHAQKKKKKKGKGKQKGKAADGEKEDEKRADIKKESQLEEKKDYQFDESLTKTKDLKTEVDDSKRPALTPAELEQSRIQSLVDEKLDEEIQLARQLLQFETACAETAPVRFRLADLNWEKSKRAFFKSQDFNVPERDRARWTQLMKGLQNETVENYKQIVDSCEGYEDFAKTLFYLGRALMEMERAKEGAQYFTRIIKDFGDSQWVANAWFMVGEFYFNNENDANKALRSYKKAAEFPTSQVYGFAVYKQGWCYMNTGDWDLALERFREVVTISDDPSQQLDQKGRLSLRKEGLKDYVRAYSNIGDAKNAYANFLKVGGKEHVLDMMERLGNWYVNQGGHRNVISVYRDLIKNYPRSTRVPIFQGRIVDATSRLGEPKTTVQQAKVLTEAFQAVRDRVAKGDLDEDEKKRIDKDLREAEDIAENTLRRLATEMYQDAKKLRGAAQERTFLLAHDLFAHYLEVFPKPTPGADVNYVFFMRFYFAEVLFKLEKFHDAAKNYDMVVDMNPNPKDDKERVIVMAAAEESVRSYNELVEDLDRKNPPEVSGTDRKEIPQVKQDLIKASKRYIEYVSGRSAKEKELAEEIVKIRYKMARIYYEYNHFDEAAPAFNDIVQNHPDNEVACYAANLALDIYNGQKNYRALKQASRSYIENTKLPCGEADKQKFAKIEEQSTFLIVKTEYEDRKNYLTAAKAYMQFYEKFPKSEFADDAVYNSAVNYDLANRLDQANKVRAFLVEKLPDSPLVPETLYNIAQSYERIVEFEKAAHYLELFAQRYPNDKRSKDALYNAGLYRATLNDIPGSKKNREQFIKLYPADEEVHTVAFSICESIEKSAHQLEGKKRTADDARKLWGDAHDCYFNYVKNSTWTKRDPDLVCHAQYRRGEIMRTKTNYQKGADEQENFVLKTWPSWKKAVGLEKLSRCAEAVATIQFRRLEPQFADYKKIKISELDPSDKGVKKFEASIKAKVDARDKLIVQYKDVAAIGVAEWGLASLFIIGELYRDSVDKLLQAPIPNKVGGETLTDDIKQILRQQLKEKATPIEESALEAYRICTTRANELGIYNKWSVKALDALQKLRPQEYQPLVERLTPLAFEDRLEVAKNGVVLPDGESFKQVKTLLEGGAVPGVEPPATKDKDKDDKGKGGKGEKDKAAGVTAEDDGASVAARQ